MNTSRRAFLTSLIAAVVPLPVAVAGARKTLAVNPEWVSAEQEFTLFQAEIFMAQECERMRRKGWRLFAQRNTLVRLKELLKPGVWPDNMGSVQEDPTS